MPLIPQRPTPVLSFPDSVKEAKGGPKVKKANTQRNQLYHKFKPKISHHKVLTQPENGARLTLRPQQTL
jgi:hypothetical protein